jgi:hypothetical protein
MVMMFCDNIYRYPRAAVMIVSDRKTSYMRIFDVVTHDRPTARRQAIRERGRVSLGLRLKLAAMNDFSLNEVGMRNFKGRGADATEFRAAQEPEKLVKLMLVWTIKFRLVEEFDRVLKRV